MGAEFSRRFLLKAAGAAAACWTLGVQAQTAWPAVVKASGAKLE